MQRTPQPSLRTTALLMLSMPIALAIAACGSGSDMKQSDMNGSKDATRLFHATPAKPRVRVPAQDRTPPLALIRVELGDGSPAIVHDSPVRSRRSPTIPLPQPGFRATALIRDEDGGTGRVRLTVEYSSSCPAGGAEQRHHKYFPPPQIVRIKIPPGVLVPTQRVREEAVTFPEDCRSHGKVFAEATNAEGLETFSDPVWFSYG
jgi:hypothetical protein